MDAKDTKKTDNTKKPYTKKIIAGILVLIAVALIITEATGLTGVVQGFFNPEMYFTEVASINHEPGSNPQVHGASSGFFLATRDSVRFHNNDGTETFRAGHNMLNPVLFGRGDFAAILEEAGRIVNVYNTAGLLYSISADHPITSFSLSSSGFSVLIMYRGNGYNIHVYNNSGRLSFHGPHVDENVIPMLTDISHDGRILAISYLDINDAQMNSFINFFFTDISDYLAHDYDFGLHAASRENLNQIIGSIGFLENGTLVAVSDTRIFGVNSANGTTTWEIPVNNRISRVDFGGNWFAVSYGEGLLNRLGHAPGTVVGYNTSGSELFSFQATGIADSLNIRGSNAIIGSDGHFTAISRSGQILWEHSLPNVVNNMIILNSTDQVAITSPAETRVLRRVRQ